MNSKQLTKVIELLKLKEDKVIPRTQNDIIICYCQWVYVEKRGIRVIDGEEHNLNAINLTDCDIIQDILWNKSYVLLY